MALSGMEEEEGGNFLALPPPPPPPPPTKTTHFLRTEAAAAAEGRERGRLRGEIRNFQGHHFAVLPRFAREDSFCVEMELAFFFSEEHFLIERHIIASRMGPKGRGGGKNPSSFRIQRTRLKCSCPCCYTHCIPRGIFARARRDTIATEKGKEEKGLDFLPFPPFFLISFPFPPRFRFALSSSLSSFPETSRCKAGGGRDGGGGRRRRTARHSSNTCCF